MKPQPRLVRDPGPDALSPIPAILWRGWVLRSTELDEQVGGTVYVRERDDPAFPVTPGAIIVEAGLLVQGEFKALAEWSICRVY